MAGERLEAKRQRDLGDVLESGRTLRGRVPLAMVVQKVGAVLAIVLLVSAAYAQIPGTINYQGSLRNNAVGVTGPVNLTFSLYDDLSAGNLLWRETAAVTVTNGLFTVQLGAGTFVSGTPLGSLPFDKPYYLAVAANGQTLEPRQALTATPYARRAAVADSVNPSTPLNIGSNTESPCDAGHAGNVRWNSPAGSLQLCDGDAWRSVTLGPKTYTVGGLVAGLTGTVVLSLNNGDALTVTANGSFAFPVPLPLSTVYSVTVRQDSPGQLCVVGNGSGTMGNANVTNVTVTCTPVTTWLSYSFEGNGNNTGANPGHAFSFTNVSYTTGKTGQGISIASSGYGQATGMRSALGSQSQLTVGFWLKESTLLSGQAFWDTNNRSSSPYGGVQLGQSGSNISVCVASTTNAFLGGNCAGFTSPSTGVWHHWLIRYAGTGTGAGQGGPTEIYVDDVLMLTRPNDGSNNPVFNPTGMLDSLVVGGNGVIMDELKVYNRVFTVAEQCTVVVGGTWTGSSCTLP